MNAPLVSMYSALRTDGREFRLPDRTLDMERIERQARYDDVVLELASMHENPDIVAALRAANPGIRLHAYVVMKIGRWPGEFFTQFYSAVAAADGFLYNIDGSYWRDSNLNLASPVVVSVVAQAIAHYLAGWDGLMLDVFCAQVPNAAASGIDFRRAGFATEAAFQQAWMLGHAALVEKIRTMMGMGADEAASGKAATGDVPSHVRDAEADLLGTRASGSPASQIVQAATVPFPIIGNCGLRSHADVMGWCRENVFDDRTWHQTMIEYVEPNGTKVPGVLNETYREPRMSWLVTRDGSTEAERQRRGRFGLGSACLRDGVHFSFERREWDAAWCRDGRYIWLKEYEHPQRGKGWLGAATDSAALHTSTMENPPGSGLWVRRFERGIVAVNPTDRAISYRGSETLRPIGKAAKKAWSIPSGDALIAEFV